MSIDLIGPLTRFINANDFYESSHSSKSGQKLRACYDDEKNYLQSTDF